MKDIKVLGIDLAKNVFQLHGTDAKGKCILRKRLNREKLIEYVAQIRPCLIGIEACLGAHYWARVFGQMGHTVKIMPPQFVKPYVMANKNDQNDARGCALVTSSEGVCGKTKNSSSKSNSWIIDGVWGCYSARNL